MTNHPNRNRSKQQHMHPFVQRERRNGVDCYVLTEAQYKALQATNAELLAALKAARPHIGVGYSAVQRRTITLQVDTAIAKAEGR